MNKKWELYETDYELVKKIQEENNISEILATILVNAVVGGGSLLILWLTLVVGMEHPAARILNLLFFIPSAIVASLFRWKQGALEIKKILPAAVAGCVCAGFFAWISRSIDIALLKKLFGVLLLFTGLRELFYRPKKAR